MKTFDLAGSACRRRSRRPASAPGYASSDGAKEAKQAWTHALKMSRYITLRADMTLDDILESLKKDELSRSCS